MRIAVPRETWPGELRAALVPSSAKKLVDLGFDVMVETGLGVVSGFPDGDYEAAGADVVKDIASALVSSEVVLRVRRPAEEDLDFLAEGTLHISFLDPFNEKPLIEKIAARGVTAVSMEMIPRTTRAQKMDALSSQASLAGYVTVVLAASHTPKVFPMMMTPAGTIAPARVFVIGAGVAGLQAIATAKRLGARVEAFDTRPVVAEQVQSLGARFVEIDIGEIGQTDQGYARELTAEQLEMQRQGMKRVIGYSDVVITTAQVFGRRAPRIVTRDMVEAMRPGSVVVDMAVESGGNVEGSVLDEVVDIDGVKLVGLGNLPSEVAHNASDMYSSNVTHFIDEFYDPENGRFDLDPADEIVAGCVLTRGGEVVSEAVRTT
ncbi:MAG: Re/Si-specific NAD(P)(+) transhydrogenase subunit alpha [Gammaproteobacteria bacterium]|nr:Re/Si-specific NAD(P)(+) transhydrogenase subunit alpha [Gammaproteobacteria bacterium]MYF27961.1 Re/Si-specific NAD(P)(+) transhydrogenase subunit alpha [Gammaproteobacteria bacterium]MYK45140.1 Re/Si-specific NAD(P)(+) transhydrogenase subunit alpha [Gammaproteobacteria bacterium]